MDEFADKFMKKMEIIFKPFIKQLVEFFICFQPNTLRNRLFNFLWSLPFLWNLPFLRFFSFFSFFRNHFYRTWLALLKKKHHIKHRVVERIGFCSNFSLFVSCSAFVHLNHFHPAATPPFSSWTFNMVAYAGPWEFSDHG